MNRNTNQRAGTVNQRRAERTAACIRLAALGLSHQAIADRLGVSRPSVSRWLAGAPQSTIEAAVTDALSVERDWRQECHDAIDLARRCLEPQLARGNPVAVMALLRSVSEVAKLEGLNTEPTHGVIPVTTIVVDGRTLSPPTRVRESEMEEVRREREADDEPEPEPLRTTPRTTAPARQ